MLAAQKGHADTVKLLLEKGAKAEARDREGWTTFELAVMSGEDAVMNVLPRPKPLTVLIESTCTQENLYSSCFATPAQLEKHVAALRLDAMGAAAIREYGAAHGKGLVEFVEAEPADAVLHVKVRPGCPVCRGNWRTRSTWRSTSTWCARATRPRCWRRLSEAG
jgi:hypothetical protein